MSDMNATQTLPLPNPGDWLDQNDTARRLDRSRRTIDRLVSAGILTLYDIGTQRLFWRAEVEQVRDAQRVLARS